MATEGLRERKKRQTRDRIVEVARELFAKNGYEATSMSEIAEGADIAVSTLFGYFPTKADIFFSGYDERVERFIQALENRRSGTTAMQAVVEYDAGVRQQRLAAGPDAPEAKWREASRAIIDATPSLLAIERDRYAPAEYAVARAVAEELGDSPDALRPRLIAAMKAGMFFAAARHRGSDAGDAAEKGRYVDACLNAAADAIATVPLPDGSRESPERASDHVPRHPR